jgi:hypothetical protein
LPDKWRPRPKDRCETSGAYFLSTQGGRVVRTYGFGQQDILNNLRARSTPREQSTFFCGNDPDFEARSLFAQTHLGSFERLFLAPAEDGFVTGLSTAEQVADHSWLMAGGLPSSRHIRRWNSRM